MGKFPICIGGRRDGRTRAVIINCILVLLIIVLAAEILFFSRFRRFYVVGDSMSPTLTGGEYSGLNTILPGGDYVYADTAATVSRFDIVVITTDNGSGGETTIIKRAIAFGGEEVELDRGVLYIDGREISEPYVSPENNTPGNSYNSFEATVVPDGCLFVLGDNRNVSVDSRDHYGMIDMDDVVGVVGEWSLGLSRLFTPINTFFDFTLPSVFSGCGG